MRLEEKKREIFSIFLRVFVENYKLTFMINIY